MSLYTFRHHQTQKRPHLISEQNVQDTAQFKTTSSVSYGDHSIPLPPHRYAPLTMSGGDTKLSSHLSSSAAFQQQHQRRTNSMNLLHPNYSIGGAQSVPPSAVAAAAAAATMPTSISSPNPPTSLSNSTAASAYSQLPKHWLWNSNFFYSQSRQIHEGFLPYSSHLSGFLVNKTKELMHPNRRNGTKTVDLSSSSYCSDANSDNDSLDVSDGKISPANSLHSPPCAKSKMSSATTNATTKKRNPYSIEELLKPEKRARTEPITFQPSILIHTVNRSESKPMKHSIDDESQASSDTEINCKNNNNITIEVCD